MTFRQAVRTVLTRKYATFHGRAGRPEFWWFWLFAAAVSLAVAAIPSVVFLLMGQDSTPDAAALSEEAFLTDLVAAGILLVVTLAVQAVVGLALVLPTVAVYTRRLHDLGKSGWWQLLPQLLWAVPTAMSVLSVETGDPSWDRYGPASSLVALAGSIGLLILLAGPGDPWPNQYGQPPGAMEDAGRPSGAPSVYAADGPPAKQSSRKPLVVALVLAVAAIIGLATERVIAEQNHQIRQTEYDDLADRYDAQKADLRQLRGERANLVDVADAWPDDIDIDFDGNRYTRGEGGTTVPYSITNTSGRTASYLVKIAIVDPDNRSDIYDSAALSTTTLAPGEKERGELYFFTNGGDWPLNAQGRWSWEVASATGFAS